MTSVIIYCALAFGVISVAVIATLAVVMWRTETADAAGRLAMAARRPCQWCSGRGADAGTCTCETACWAIWCGRAEVRKETESA